MSVTISKYMEVISSDKSMKEILGNIVRPMAVTRYGRPKGVYTPETKTLEAIDLFEIAPQLFDKEADKKRGFVIIDCGHGDKNKYISQGFEIIEEAGSITYRRPYEKEILESLYREPMRYCNDGNALRWSENYMINEVVDIAISVKFPDIIFDVYEHVEGDEVAHYHLKNGKIIKDYYKEEAM